MTTRTIISRSVFPGYEIEELIKNLFCYNGELFYYDDLEGVMMRWDKELNCGEAVSIDHLCGVNV